MFDGLQNETDATACSGTYWSSAGVGWPNYEPYLSTEQKIRAEAMDIVLSLAEERGWSRKKRERMAGQIAEYIQGEKVCIT